MDSLRVLNLGRWASMLIVEDSEADEHMLRVALQEAGNDWKIEVARSADGALAILRQNPNVALVMADLNLSATSGLDLLSAMRSDSTLGPIPVLMISGADDAATVISCYEAGANAVIPKVPDLDVFFWNVRQIHQFWCSEAILPTSGRAEFPRKEP